VLSTKLTTSQEDEESNIAPHAELSDRNAEPFQHVPPSTPTVPTYSGSKVTAQVDESLALAASVELQAEHDLSLMLNIAFGHALVKAQQDSLLIPADPEHSAVIRLSRAFASVMFYHNLGQFSKVVHGELEKLLPGHPTSSGPSKVHGAGVCQREGEGKCAGRVCADMSRSLKN
jgi:hypothetical protein